MKRTCKNDCRYVKNDFLAKKLGKVTFYVGMSVNVTFIMAWKIQKRGYQTLALSDSLFLWFVLRFFVKE